MEESWPKPYSSFKYSSLGVDGDEDITSDTLLNPSSSGKGTAGKTKYSLPFSKL